jgi:hypothetical protein
MRGAYGFAAKGSHRCRGQRPLPAQDAALAAALRHCLGKRSLDPSVDRIAQWSELSLARF